MTMSVPAPKKIIYILSLVGLLVDTFHPLSTTTAFSQNSKSRNRSNKNNINVSNNIDPQPRPDEKQEVELEELNIDTNRRNLVVTAPLGVAGAVVYGKLLADSVEKLSRGDPNFVYPPEHEDRVKDMISTAIMTSLLSQQPKQSQEKRPFRILEVGVGPQLRLIRRGLYNDAMNQVAKLGIVQELEWTGIDIQSLPSLDSPIVQQAQSILKENDVVKTDLTLIQSSISNSPSRANKALFDDGYFDSIISSLTLCSVVDPESSVREIYRMLRQDGGTFGYVEHVAVDDDEPYTALKYQQIIFDPLQQMVADNCHLHRSTTQTVASVFGVAAVTTTSEDSISIPSKESKFIQNERFIVDKMWPVSLQTSVVVQKTVGLNRIRYSNSKT